MGQIRVIGIRKVLVSSRLQPEKCLWSVVSSPKVFVSSHKVLVSNRLQSHLLFISSISRIRESEIWKIQFWYFTFLFWCEGGVGALQGALRLSRPASGSCRKSTASFWNFVFWIFDVVFSEIWILEVLLMVFDDIRGEMIALAFSSAQQLAQTINNLWRYRMGATAPWIFVDQTV